MFVDVVTAEPLDGYRLRLRFEDGTEGVVDVAKLIPFTGVFAELKDPKAFAAVTVNRELGTVCWPGGADLDPDVLYSIVSGEPLPGKSETPNAASPMLSSDGQT